MRIRWDADLIYDITHVANAVPKSFHSLSRDFIFKISYSDDKLYTTNKMPDSQWQNDGEILRVIVVAKYIMYIQIFIVYTDTL